METFTAIVTQKYQNIILWTKELTQFDFFLLHTKNHETTHWSIWLPNWVCAKSLFYSLLSISYTIEKHLDLGISLKHSLQPVKPKFVFNLQINRFGI